MDNFDKQISSEVKSFLDKNVKFKNTEKYKILQKIERSNRKTKKFYPAYWTVLASAAIVVCLLSLSFLNDGTNNILNNELTGSDIANEPPKISENEKSKTCVDDDEKETDVTETGKDKVTNESACVDDGENKTDEKDTKVTENVEENDNESKESTIPVEEKKDTEAPETTVPDETQPTQPTSEDEEPVILDGEPMDDYGFETHPMIYENEKVGYIQEIIRDENGKVILSVDFAELEFNKEYTNGYKLENREVKVEKITIEKEPLYFYLEGTNVITATMEEIDALKNENVLFTFLHTDEDVIFLIEERYLPE